MLQLKQENNNGFKNVEKEYKVFYKCFLYSKVQGLIQNKTIIERTLKVN